MASHVNSLLQVSKNFRYPWKPEAPVKSDRSAALLLLGAAILGLVLANSPVGFALLDLKATNVGIEALNLSLPIQKWTSDLLLAAFFLVAGLELKYELSKGVLSKLSTALVPVVAGIGGIAIPALVYSYFNWGTEYMVGWPIPTATDIAFALGVLAIFGRGLPKAARVFLLALAIFDDLVAIMVIAIFYTDNLAIEWLFAAALVLAAHAIAERVPRIPIVAIRFLSFGLAWYAVYQSGVHATIAGVAMGLIIPATRSHSLVAKIQPWTNTVALPVFAFFAVSIALPTFEGEVSSVFNGIAIALPVGKIVGITAFALLANLLAEKSARLNLHPLDFAAVAGLAGIGFTVSLLMTKLAFESMPEIRAEATLAVIVGSLLSLAFGAYLSQLRGRHYAKLAKQQDQ
ncbi:MAG: sodium:proton antiporter [Actinobacteria bacterium]|nr:sodium:proton antiporter [Actinomycetota bacterium]MTA89989.1 sodium:proton antiporter [Actinomycetota bacterium]